MSPTLDFIIRLLAASAAGALIGVERRYRAKGAGIGTHVLVSIGAALFMIVSEYGFSAGKSFDVSRVAAGVVSGIGFLGGGIILKQQNRVSGLTTAAGLWVTAAMGMAIGGGMYVLGGATVAIVLVWVELTHILNRRLGKRQVSVTLTSGDPDALKRTVRDLGRALDTYSLSKRDGVYRVTAVLTIRNMDYADLADRMTAIPGVEMESLE